MAAPQISTKRLAISKANAQIVGIVAAASFVTVFCLVASQAVWSQNRYQAKVITQKEKARDQLKSNITAYSGLVKSYDKFNKADPNIISGSRDGNGANDGDNTDIVLDALPSNYDFPALASSIEKLLASSGVKVGGITGTDDGTSASAPAATPKASEIPFTFTVTDANYSSLQRLTGVLKSSIRPIQIDKISISGGGEKITATFDAHTFYQAGKSVEVTKQVVK